MKAEISRRSLMKTSALGSLALRRLQIFSVGFVAGLKQQYRRDLLQGDVNPRMATAVGNNQVWFQSGNGFQARLRARSDGLAAS